MLPSFHRPSAGRRAGALLLVAALGLAGCGGGNNPATPATPSTPSTPSTPAATATLSGVVAVGDPVAGAQVKASCAAALQRVSLPTSATGAWTLDIPATALPCGLEATGGTVAGAANTTSLHSVATTAGNVSITPLTDLAIARAAGKSPSAWFADLASAPAGAGLDVHAAVTQIAAALASAGYTVPAASFDPFAAAFEARPGDAYDNLLDALRAALARAGTSYDALLAQFAASGTAALALPSATATTPPDTPPVTPPATRQAAPITLIAKGSANALDVAPLTGTYQGTLGRVFTAGQPTLETTSCTITVADGMMTVAAGGKSYGAAMSGDVGDLILHVLNLDRIQASDTANDRYVQLTTVRGFLSNGVARQGGTGFSTAPDRVECTLPNPETTTAGAATASVIQGATASDFAASQVVGNYTGNGCALTVSNAGVFHFTGNGVDVTTTLGGDETDVISTFAGGSFVVQAQDYFAGGTETYISLAYDAGNTALHIAPSYSVDVSRRVPTPTSLLARCTLARQ